MVVFYVLFLFLACLIEKNAAIMYETKQMMLNTFNGVPASVVNSEIKVMKKMIPRLI
jgi:hypothetical protein